MELSASGSAVRDPVTAGTPFVPVAMAAIAGDRSSATVRMPSERR